MHCSVSHRRRFLLAICKDENVQITVIAGLKRSHITLPYNRTRYSLLAWNLRT